MLEKKLRELRKLESRRGLGQVDECQGRSRERSRRHGVNARWNKPTADSMGFILARSEARAKMILEVGMCKRRSEKEKSLGNIGDFCVVLWSQLRNANQGCQRREEE
jgi:hypothetical protein